MIKRSFEERVAAARKIKEEMKPCDKGYKEEVLKAVTQCLKEEMINGKASKIKCEEVDYSKMPVDKERKRTSLIFIQFTENGHIAVVGAGEDISFSYNYATGSILKEIGEEWDKEELIVITIEDLESVGLKNVTNVLRCRNGMENYVGDYLVTHGFPVLNNDQHWNYKIETWEKWKRNGFEIK